MKYTGNNNLLSMFATAVLASLVFSVTLQQQNVAASNGNDDKLILNQHSHTKIDEKHGITGNEVSVFNDGTSHTNSNFNYIIIEEKHLKKDLRLIPTTNLLTTNS
jgi:hypothetical protein